MNPILLYNILDTKGNVIFKFPPNTLLEKITDVWPLIIDYYENYYPFAVGTADENYREVTLEESKSNEFTKLFSAIYMDNKIKSINYSYHGCISVSVNRFSLLIKGGIHNSETVVWIIKNNLKTGFNDKLDDILNVYVSESPYCPSNTIPLLVLSHIIFN